MDKYLALIKNAGTARIIKAAVIFLVLLYLALLPMWGDRNTINVLLLIFLYMALAQMWNLLGGYAGLISLGQQIFVGLGGYSLAIITRVYDMHFLIGFLVAGVISVLFALVISVPIFKMKGVYFTIGTWIIAEGLTLLFRNWGFVNYSIGHFITVTRSWSAPQQQMYYLAFAVAIITFAVVYILLRSKLGLALMAMRDNEAAAEVRGVSLYGTKLRCFLISSFMTGLIGAALYLNQGQILPDAAFSIDWTISMVFIVIIGGIGTLEAPIIGAVIFVLLRQRLFDFPGYSMAILGAIAVILILVAPRGVMGTISDKTGFEVFSARRRVKDMARRLNIIKENPVSEDN